MKFKQYITEHTVAKTSEFNGEIHAIVIVNDASLTFAEQLRSVSTEIVAILMKHNGYVPVFMRLLLSDAANQAETAVNEIRKISGNAAVAYIQQPPLNGAKIAVLAYLRQEVEIERVDDYTVKFSKDGLSHYFTANVVNPIANTYDETKRQLEYLENMLKTNNLNIADNCIRTWFYVQNIDVNYNAVVRARRDNFNENNLTVDTHYISSTGICGRYADKNVTSVMDAYCVGGIKQNQIKFLYAADHLNRTSDYGVTFERGTAVDFADRRLVIISGTASIDNKGAIVAPGDIKAQTLRMIENVKALLNEGGASFEDIAHIVCYLRDTADYNVVKTIFEATFGKVPMVITLAPVCRPGWLIEMECMAVAKR